MMQRRIAGRAVAGLVLALAMAAPAVPAQAGSAPLWVAISDGAGPERTDDFPYAIALSPSTGDIVVTGSSRPDTVDIDYATVVYDSSGATVGAAEYDSKADLDPDYDTALAVAVNPVTGAIYVTGASDTAGGDRAAVTVAYDRLGRQQWVAQYNEPGDQRGVALAVDARSGNVYVGGTTALANASDYVTLAYSAEGDELWTARYDGPVGGQERASDLVVDPGTGVVYITGDSEGQDVGLDYATVAYGSGGAQVWVARYDGPEHANEFAPHLGFGAGRLVVSGQSLGTVSDFDFATVAYNRLGRQLWEARYTSPGAHTDIMIDVAVDPGTGAVYVSGDSYAADVRGDIVTVAYAPNGSERWVAVNRGQGVDLTAALALDSRRGTVYVTGTTQLRKGEPVYQLTTLAYGPQGALLRTDNYSGPDTSGRDRAVDIAVDPGNGNVYVTGETKPQGGAHDFTTIAYPPASP